MKKYLMLVSILCGMLLLASCSGEKKGTAYETIDVFEQVTVNITGIAPFAAAQLVLSEGTLSLDESSFSIDKTENIKNDDVITVECLISDEEAHEAGYDIINRQKLYYVRNLDQYINNVDQLSGTVLQEIVDEAVQTVSDDTEALDTRMLYKLTGKSNYLFQYNKEWVDSITIKDILLCTPMEYSEDETENIIYLLFEVVVSNSDYSENGYYFFRYDDAILSGSGILYINHSNPETRYYCASEYEELYNMLIEPLTGQFYIGSVDAGELVINISQ